MDALIKFKHTVKHASLGPGRQVAVLLLISYFLSGLSALIYQVVWQRDLVRLTGSSLPSVAIVLAGVMAGLAVGARFGAHLIGRRLNPLLVYFALELNIGFLGMLFALAIGQPIFQFIFDYPAIEAESYHPLSVCARYFLALLVVFLPALAMGATLPVVVASAVKASMRNAAATLYGVNLLGAFAGSLAAAFVLIPSLGLSGAAIAAAFVNLAAGFLALLSGWLASFVKEGGFEREHPSLSFDKSEADAEKAAPGRLFTPIRILIACTAFISMALEVVWTRLFMLVLGSSTYSIAVVLSGTLLGMGAAAWMARRFVVARSRLVGIAAPLLLAAAGSLLLSSHIAHELPFLFSLLSSLLPDWGRGFAGYVALRALAALAIVVLPAFFLALFFPVALQSLTAANSPDGAIKTGRTAADLYFLSCAGAILGALAQAFVIFPIMSASFSSGIKSGLMLFEIALVTLALFALFAARQEWQPLTLAKRGVLGQNGMVSASCAMAALALFASPAWNPHLMSAGVSFLELPENVARDRSLFMSVMSSGGGGSKEKILFYREGTNTTVTVASYPERNVVALKNDGKSEAALPENLSIPAPSSDYDTQMLLGLIPVMVSSKTPQSALVIGYGSGTTTGALALSGVPRIVAAELEPAVFEAGRFFDHANGRPLRLDWRKEGRVIPRLVDGRNLLTFSGRRYDIIVSQPAEPWISGASDLFTREFFRTAKARLSQGGIFCQWIQLYAIDEASLALLLNTFHDVFPASFVFHPHGSGELILIGSDRLVLDIESIKRQMIEPSKARALERMGLRSWHDFIGMLVLTPSGVSEYASKILSRIKFPQLNTDSNLFTEYRLPQRLFAGGGTVKKNLESLRAQKIDLLECLKNLGSTANERADAIDRVALAQLEAKRRYGADALEETALSLAYEAWKISDNPATRAAGDVIAELAGKRGGVRPRPAGHSKSVTAGAEAPVQSADHAYWLAELNMAEGNYEPAAKLFGKALSLAGHDSDGCKVAGIEARLGRALILLNRPLEAASHLRSALSSKEDDALWQEDLGRCYFSLSKWNEAEALFRSSLNLEPGRYQARILLAKTLIKQGKESDAVSEFLNAHRQEPHNSEPVLCIAARQVIRGQLSLAEKNVSLLLRSRPVDKRAYLIAFALYRDLGKQSQAQANLGLYGDPALADLPPASLKSKLSAILD